MPKRGPRNVDISHCDFPARLQAFRMEAGLSKLALAKKAGISWRAVHDIEKGVRARIQEHTLLSLAAALGIPPQELLQSPPTKAAAPILEDAGAPISVEADPREPAPVDADSGSQHRQRRNPVRVAALALVFLALAWGLGSVWRAASLPIACEPDGNWLVIQRQWLGNLRVGPYEAPVRRAWLTPWKGGRIVVSGLSPQGEAGGTLIAVNGSTGRQQWTVRPPYPELVAFFGEERAELGSFMCDSLVFGDVDGDDTVEAVALFSHQTWFPGYCDVINRKGDRLGDYLNWGHLYDARCVDMDDDGKAEIFVTGTNNSPAYQGATVILLDEDHLHGASTDSNVRPESGIPDGSLARVVLPLFEARFADAFNAQRLTAKALKVSRTARGSHRIEVSVESNADTGLLVTMDEALRPLDASASDALLHAISDWPPELQAEFLAEETRSDWLARHSRFGAPSGSSDEVATSDLR